MNQKAIKAAFGLIIFSAFFFSGCMSVNHQVTKSIAQKQSLMSVDISKNTSSLNAKETELFEKTLLTRLEKAGFQKSGKNKLTIEYKVVNFNPGSRFLRYMFGIFGAGKATLTLEIKYMKDGKVLSEAKVDGQLRIGTFGGPAGSLFEEAGLKVAEYTIANFK